MKQLGKLYDIISRKWFMEEPVRINWFLRLLDAMDDGGVAEMSRAKYGRLFNCTAKAAYCFLSYLDKQGVLSLHSDTNSTKVIISSIEDYYTTGRNLGAIWAQGSNCDTCNYTDTGRNLGAIWAQNHDNGAQNNDNGRNLGAIWAQGSNCISDNSDTQGRNLGAIWAQSQELQEKEKEKRKEKAEEKETENETEKENTFSPTPPILKEKDKEKEKEKEDEKEKKKEKEKEDPNNNFLIRKLPEKNFSATENQPKIEKVDFKRLLDMYHSICTSFQKVIRLSDTRKRKVEIRFVDEMKSNWETLEQVFRKMEESKFLRGDNKHGWKATFDWLFTNDKNWCKVLEGNYDNKKNVSSNEVYRQQIQDKRRGYEVTATSWEDYKTTF